jgi:hypothetical protein
MLIDKKPTLKPNVDGRTTRTLQDWINVTDVLSPVTNFQTRNTQPTLSKH